jgi:phospholipid transport system substrate-binding protein
MTGHRKVLAAFVLLLAAYLPTSISSALASPQEPAAFVNDLGQRAIKLLSDKTTTEENQRDKFRALLREGFATRAIGYFVIGKYRRSIPKAKVKEFVDTFENFIVELYSSQFRHYSGESFKVARVIKTSRPTDWIVVTNILRPTGEHIIKAEFQVRQRSQKPSKILDVKLSGISMILAQRDEFTAYISQNDGNIQALIDVLNSRIKKLKKKGLGGSNASVDQKTPSEDASSQTKNLKPVNKTTDVNGETQDQG